MASRNGSPRKTPFGPLTPRRAGKGNGAEGEIQFVEDDAIEVVDNSSDEESTVKTSFKNGHSSSSRTASQGAVGGQSSATIPLDTSIESMPSSIHSQNGLDCE